MFDWSIVLWIFCIQQILVEKDGNVMEYNVAGEIEGFMSKSYD